MRLLRFFETIRLDERAPVYSYVFTSDPYTEELVEIPIFQVRNREEMQTAIAASGGPEARGYVSNDTVIAWDSHKLVHSDVDEYLEEMWEEEEDAPPVEEWIASVYFYPDGVALSPNPRTGYHHQEQLQFLIFHPILVRIYGQQPVPIIQPKGGIR